MSGPAHRHSPRSATALLSEALNHLDLLPPGAREPVRHMFRAAIEVCVTSRSLLGTPVVFVLELAQSLVDEERPDADEEDPA
jgi:hypothetical protein